MNTNEIKNTNTTNTNENAAVAESTAAETNMPNMTSETLYSEIPPISVEGDGAHDGISVMCVGGSSGCTGGGNTTGGATNEDSECHNPDCTCPDCEGVPDASGNIPVKSMKVSIAERPMLIGDSCYIGAIICPENATNPEVTWQSTNTGVVTAIKDSVGCRLTAVGKGSALVIATTTDGTNLSDGCLVTVTKDNTVYVTSVTLPTPTMTLTVGDTKTLTATVEPSDATNKTLSWSSSDNAIASVTQNGIVTAEAVGRATITVTSTDGSDVYDSVYVNVILVPVSSVSVSPEQITIKPGETATITATVSPCDASDKTVKWMSSNISVATVEADTGVVTARSDGSATITATTFNGNKTDTCTVNVDSRERVTIRKDSHSFYVEFADGNVWKNIGMDLSKRSDHYSELYPPEFIYENYPDLIEEERRYFDNIYVENQTWEEFKSYSVKQIGFLYVIDPFGIEYYMRHHVCHDMNLGETLFFKDRVYAEIFGVFPRLIKVFPDKTIQYYEYPNTISASTRANYYTDAEILFGEHPIYDWLSTLSFLSDVVPEVTLSLFSSFYPPLGVVLGSIELVKFLFFSASATGVLSSGTNSIMEKYTGNIYTMSHGESAGVKAEKAMGWVNLVLGAFNTILDAAIEFTPSINDVVMYNRINEYNYLVKYNVNDSELTMSDIIARASLE